MRKYILKTDGNFLHFESGGILSWHSINPEALCVFDTRDEAQEIINNFELDAVICVEHFSETFFD